MKSAKFALAALILTLMACNSEKIGFKTPLEKTGFSAHTTNARLAGFIDEVSQLNPLISVKYYDVSGKKFPVVTIRNSNSGEEKLRAMLLGQMHGNEPSGMEGLLLLIRDFGNGKHTQLLSNLELLILPQCNPWGADRHVRTNENGLDLNRDQLLIRAQESKIIQNLFDAYRPHMTVDFHEYYPYGRSWQEFGYRRNFDIQLGGLTNINIDSALVNLFYHKAFPYVKNTLEEKGYTFFEYTLGNFALGERLRRSTVDINDGRQSFGIAGTFSMIVEGINGLDSLHRIQRRAESQHATALALLEVASLNKAEIISKVDAARHRLIHDAGLVSIRQDHFKGDSILAYPLTKFNEEIDTVFLVKEYHTIIRSLLDVASPDGYLIPKNDTLLVGWLQRSNFRFAENTFENEKISGYQIIGLRNSLDEELENYFPDVIKTDISSVSPHNYYYLPLNQIYRHKIITALEPQAMYGLINYPEFHYLLSGSVFPILRVER